MLCAHMGRTLHPPHSISTRHQFPSEFGPRVCRGRICYRLVANTVIEYLSASEFDNSTKYMTERWATDLYTIALSVAVVSLAATIWSFEHERCRTFYGSMTGCSALSCLTKIK